MDTKEVLYELRMRKGLSQSELADKVFVTRQAVSRWEKGHYEPTMETKRKLKKLFEEAGIKED